MSQRISTIRNLVTLALIIALAAIFSPGVLAQERTERIQGDADLNQTTTAPRRATVKTPEVDDEVLVQQVQPSQTPVIVAPRESGSSSSQLRSIQQRLQTQQQPATTTRIGVQPQRLSPASSDGDPDLPVITPRASRTQIDPPSLQLNTGPSDNASPPAKLSNTQKAALIKGAAENSGGNINAPDLSMQSVTLTPRRPFVQNKGSAIFLKSSYVDARDNRAGFPPPSGNLKPQVNILLNVVQGNRYLVDLLVYGTRPQTFTILHAGGQQAFNESAGGNHLLFVLEPNGSGYVSLTLEAQDYFTFYAAEITKI